MNAMLLTLPQVATRLRCSTGYVRKLIAGKVPDMPPLRGMRLHRWLIPKKALKDWLAKLQERQSPAREKPVDYRRNGHGHN
jgi:Helix-turn-helix domain